MEDEARRRVVQWLEAAPSALDILSRLVDEQGRLRHAMEAAERECALLREELAAIRAENDRLVKVGREIDELIVTGLGKRATPYSGFAGLAPKRWSGNLRGGSSSSTMTRTTRG